MTSRLVNEIKDTVMFTYALPTWRRKEIEKSGAYGESNGGTIFARTVFGVTVGSFVNVLPAALGYFALQRLNMPEAINEFYDNTCLFAAAASNSLNGMAEYAKHRLNKSRIEDKIDKGLK
jgi:hypothetical protein